MTGKQLAFIVAAVALVAALYLFADITPPERRGQMAQLASASGTAGLEGWMQQEQARMDEASAAGYAKLAESVNYASDSAAKAAKYAEMAAYAAEDSLWLTEAEHYFQSASFSNSAGDWVQTGDKFAALLLNARQDTAALAAISNRAITAYSNALEIDSNLDTKVKLASVYVDGAKDVMAGVTLLLDVVKDDPDNIKANLILGRYGMISGQFDKAVARLEKVIEADSLHAEAYFYLAEAYNMLGDKDKSIKFFEICKQLVDNPAFSEEIDSYIADIKNS